MSANASPDADVPMNVICSRLSAHLGVLAAYARKLETLGAPDDLPMATPDVITTLQNIDHMRQVLTDMTILTAQLACSDGIGHLRGKDATRILAQLQLETMRAVLQATDPCQTDGRVSERTPGEPMLF